MTHEAHSSVRRNAPLFFRISLAEWSLHRTLRSGQLDNLDFPAMAKEEFGIEAVEYVNVFFKDKAKNTTYLSDLKKRCSDHGVTSLLIMCDGEGYLADTNSSLRQKAVENHHQWVEAAAFLGCHSIRVNCHGVGSPEEVAKTGVDGLRKLSEFAKPAGIHVIVENHGGYSSDGQWISGVIRSVGMPNCGTLPDFGNFSFGNNAWYDRYQGVREMMPFAKGVSAKSIDFDENGNCKETNYERMLPIVREAGYTGYIGIEYEGDKLTEAEGIKATKALLERVGASMK
ncbi:MAG: sugar phosphate isomerase/epimerase family protein [Cytophagales bacterium]|nr:sugar phosphate isomerase/epimerase family protein [Cytophagales bacterium]